MKKSYSNYTTATDSSFFSIGASRPLSSTTYSYLKLLNVNNADVGWILANVGNIGESVVV